MENDMNKINEAKENLNDAYQNYQDDHTKIIEYQSNTNAEVNNSDKLTSNLALAGSVATLGAIGSGLYFALPLLLGGSKKLKKNKLIKKTRRLKNKYI
jgi:putative sterol carrier protein